MNLKWITSSVVALGLTAAIPSFARADVRRDWHDNDRYHDRYDHDRDVNRVDVRYERDFDTDVNIRDVPRVVLDTVDRERHGRRIEAVQYVLRDGKYFYRFRIDDPGRRDIDMNLRVNPGGRLLSIEEAQQCDPGYFRVARR
ncbi:MAG TPA: hypothetical protein VH475_17905 [Tepidisphaeraceae bacterium]|jgi:hypothetical protein